MRDTLFALFVAFVFTRFIVSDQVQSTIASTAQFYAPAMISLVFLLMIMTFVESSLDRWHAQQNDRLKKRLTIPKTRVLVQNRIDAEAVERLLGAGIHVNREGRVLRQTTMRQHR